MRQRNGTLISSRRRHAVGNLLRLGILLGLLLVPPTVYAASVALPHVFQNGMLTDAGEMNANFAAVKTAVDDNDSRLDMLLGQSCPAGEIVTGVDLVGNLLCAPPP